jgi:hypothetical protein
MSDADWTISQGTQNPVFTDTLSLSDGTIPPLEGATLQFVMRSLTSVSPLTLTGTASIVDILTGAVQYAPTAQDTAVPGMYMAQWIVHFGQGSQMTWPTVGYLSVEVQASLTSEAQQLVSLPDVKEYLGMPASQRDHDHQLVAMIEGMRPEIERIMGPIFPTLYDEKYRGGNDTISLINRPSAGTGCSPFINILGVVEYRGPIAYPLSLIPDPVEGSIYSCEVDTRMGTVTRRTAGGSTIPFPVGANSVHIVYQAGQSFVPPNVRLACLEVVRMNFRLPARAGRGAQTQADTDDSGEKMPFSMRRHLRELIGPAARGPAFG